MKRNVRLAAAALVLGSSAYAEQAETPTVQDLDFIVGTWALTFDNYDPRDPEKGLIARETGQMVCAYELPQRDAPRFVTCNGELVSERWGKRTFREAIGYNHLVGSFERIGQFSSWPTHSEERVTVDSKARTLVARGALRVESDAYGFERWEDVTRYNEDFTAYERTQYGNFPTMPANVYEVTFRSTARKIAD